jgi:hypothetical protein
LKEHLTGSFSPQGRAGLALPTPLYTIRTRPLLTQRLYKAAFVKAVIGYYDYYIHSLLIILYSKCL